MLQRILALPEETLDRYDLLAASKVVGRVGLGAARRPGPGAGWTTFGDNLYNIYGSTEVAYASIATPRDLREAPTSAGQAAVGDRGEDPRRRRAASVPHGGDRPDLRRQRPALRGLHRRRVTRRSSTG